MTDQNSSPPEPPLGAGLDLTGPDSPLAPYFLRPGELSAFVLLSLIAFVYGISPLWHSDVWGHLKYAETFVETRSLPSTEPFCEFADKKTPLIHYAWLGQLTALAAYNLGDIVAGGDHERRLAGGVAGIRTLSLALAVGISIFFLLAYRRSGSSWGAAAAGLLLYNLLAPTGLGVFRTQLFGVFLFALLLWMLADSVWTWKGAVTGIVVLILWGNLHGSFIMGLALIGAFAAGRALTLCRHEGRWSLFRWLTDASVGWMLATIAGGIVGVLILNPYSFMLPVHILKFSGHPVTATFDEFQPLNTTLGPGALYFYITGMVILFGSWITARRWPSPTEVLLVLIFGIAPIFQRRLLVWWIPLIPLLVAPAWALLLKRWGAEGDGAPHLRNTFMAVVLVALALVWTPPARWLVGGEPTPLAQAVTAVTPWQITRQLRQEPTETPFVPRLAKALQRYPEGHFTGRIFANEALGDWFLWDTPAYPIIVYSHSHVFTMSHWRDCLTVKFGEPGWDRLLDRWGVNLVVVEAAGHPYLCAAMRKDPRWSVVEDGMTDPTSPGPFAWRFVAIRKQPIVEGNQ